MKASEVTESGFYWWKDTESEGYCESEWPSPDGWQVVYAEVSRIIVFYKTGSEVLFWDNEMPGEIIGPIAPHMLCLTPGEDLTERLLGKGKGNEA